MFGFKKKVNKEMVEMDNRIDALEELTMRMLKDQQRQLNIMMDVTKTLDERITALEKRA